MLYDRKGEANKEGKRSYNKPVLSKQRKLTDLTASTSPPPTEG